MIQTKVTRTLASAGLAPAGKLSHSYHSLLPVLALCLATAAWSQTTGPRGPHRPSILSGLTSSAKPAADTPASSRYKFITIVVPGSPNTQPYGINNDRLVTGYYQDASLNYHGFVWQAGAFQTVDYPGAVYTILYAVNNLGVAIGYYGDGTAEHVVMYSVPTGTWTLLPDIPGYADNEGYGINDSGVAVGNAYQGSTNAAWVWRPGMSAYSFFSDPAAVPSGTYPGGINDKGQVAGYFCITDPCYNASNEVFGFLRQGKTYTTIAPPGASGTYAGGINNSGTMDGQWQDAAGAAQGFVLTSSGLYTTVDYPGPKVTGLGAINDHGDITGVYVEDPSGYLIAFMGIPR